MYYEGLINEILDLIYVQNFQLPYLDSQPYPPDMYTCTDGPTKTPRSGTSIQRECVCEIYVERVPSVAYLYQLCPGLSKPDFRHLGSSNFRPEEMSRHVIAS